MSRDGLLRGCVLAALLVALGVLAYTHVATLLAWTERCVPISRYPALFTAFFVTWLACRGAWRREALLVGSLVCGAIFEPLMFAAMLAWIGVLYVALRVGTKTAVGFVIGTHIALAVVCNRDLWPELIAQHGFIARWGYVFAVAYTLRVVWLLHHVHVRADVPAFGDFVTYLAFAPFYVIVPYMLAIPRYDRFYAALDRHDRDVEWSGLRLITAGIALTVALAALDAVYDPYHAALAAFGEHRYAVAFGHSLVRYPTLVVLQAIAISSIVIGLVRVLGIDLGPAMDRVHLSRNITDWWRRWNAHFRELLVDIFYYPVVMRWRRQRVRATILGCASVFLLGSTLLHWPKAYFRAGTLAALPVDVLAENVVMFIAVSIALVREQRGKRSGGVVTALVLVFVANMVVGNAAQAAWNAFAFGTERPAFYNWRNEDVFPYF